jgi:hypothetical protein
MAERVAARVKVTAGREEVADLRKAYARIAAAADDIKCMLDEKRFLATGETSSDGVVGGKTVTGRTADALEDVRQMLFDAEERLNALENSLLDVVQKETYATPAGGPGQTGDGRPRDESAHVPSLQDLTEIESETGIADLASHRRTRATVLYTLQGL